MKDGPSSFLRMTTAQGRPRNLDGHPPVRPPLHLPVLTEVVPLQETVPGALMVLPDEPAATEPGPLFEGQGAIPEWLLRKDVPIPTAPAMPLAGRDDDEVRLLDEAVPAAPPERALPGFHGQVAESPAPSASSGFASSWWMTDGDHDAASLSTSAPQPFFPTPVPEPAPPPPPAREPVPQFVLNEAQLVKSVLVDLDQQVSLMFEHRMREVMVPAFARATDALMNELRVELALRMREMVARSVAIAVARHAKGLGTDD
jgi:hypothetical protein